MSDTPVAPLPPSYDWGFVVGRSISAIADTVADPDRFPEARGSNGRVTFTPHTRYKKEISAPTAFVHFEVITAKIVNGNVVDAQGENGIYLISGAYKVAFTIDSGSIPGFDILVKPEHTLENPLDLVTAAPFVPEDSAPVTTAIIPAGAAEGQVIAWRNGRLVWVNGSVQAEAAAARAEAAAIEAEEWTPSFEWDGTSLVINDGDPVDLRGEKGDGSSWAELTGKPTSFPSTVADVDGIVVDTSVGTRVSIGGTTVFYDSGWRDITEMVTPGTLVKTPGSTESLRVRRTADTVEFMLRLRVGEALAGKAKSRNEPFLENLPVSLQQNPPAYATVGQNMRPDGVIWISNGNLVSVLGISSSQGGDWVLGEQVICTAFYSTRNVLPTTLPGDPA